MTLPTKVVLIAFACSLLVACASVSFRIAELSIEGSVPTEEVVPEE